MKVNEIYNLSLELKNLSSLYKDIENSERIAFARDLYTAVGRIYKNDNKKLFNSIIDYTKKSIKDRIKEIELEIKELTK